MADSPNSPEITLSPFSYDEPPKAAFCSVMACPSGHEWPPTLQITQCPGCRTPVIAIKMTNCPVCNEPSATMKVRADHLSRGIAITATCRGSATQADTHMIELKLDHAAQEQAAHVVRAMPGKV